MSDGPHRSLPMCKRWKQVAECVYNEAYGPEQVDDALSAAVAEDWRREIPEGLLNKVQIILSNSQTELFPEQRHQKLETLRVEIAGRPLANTFMSHAVYAAEKRISGKSALLDSACGAITDFAERGLRQVEEHYHRETPRGRITDVRRRANEAMGRLDAAGIARRLLGIDVSRRPLSLVKQTDLDAGVPL